MKLNITAAGCLALLAALVIGCQTAPKSAAEKSDLESSAQQTLSRMKQHDTSIDDMIDRGHGYVIFPNAGKGAFVLGGGYGKGVVYDDAGRQIGFADITQLSAGAQIGGQSFAELIVFENENALNRFKNNQVTFGANASAVIIREGVASSGSFQDGFAVYVMPKAGAMAEAAVAGQRFTYSAAEGSGQATTRPAQRASETEAPTEPDTEVRTTETKTEVEVEQRRNTD